MAAQFTSTRGWLQRNEWLWMACAIISLPVPVSPAMRTAAGCRATFSASRITRCSDALRITRPGCPGSAKGAGASSSFFAAEGEDACSFAVAVGKCSFTDGVEDEREASLGGCSILACAANCGAICALRQHVNDQAIRTASLTGSPRLRHVFVL